MKADVPSSSNDRRPAPPGETVAATPIADSVTLSPPTEGMPARAAGTGNLPEQLPAPFGRYQLLKLLGRGGMGSVYLARDTQLDRSVALKVPQFSASDEPRVLERFLREARAAATLHHANICPVHDVGEIDGVHYLTMAYLEGRSLAEILRGNKKPIPLRQAAALVRKLALALAEAHRHKVVHRDLKPGNIMVSRGSEPIIMDFGLAHRGDTPDVRLTQQGCVLGTPAYMAPEQAKGAIDQIGPACDIYSLGVILYELLTHRLPFSGDTFSVLTQVLTDEPPPPSRHCADIDDKMERICLKAMAKQPADRYATMTDFAAALADYLKNPDRTVVTEAKAPRLADKSASVEAPSASTPVPSRRGRWLVGLALAGMVVVFAGAGIWLSTHRARPAIEPETPTETDALREIKADAPVPYSWPEEALRGGKVAAPALSQVKPLLHDTFANPASGFPKDKGNAGRKGYRDGKYFIDVPGRGSFFWFVPIGRSKPAPPSQDFACALVGQAKGLRARWGLGLIASVAEQPPRHLNISLGTNGFLHVGSPDGKVADKGMDQAKTVSHAAIKSGEQVRNTLLVVVRGRHVEIYVNGFAVCNPILLEKTIPSPRLALHAFSATPQGATAEFESITIWPTDSIPPLEQRGAKPKP